MASQKTMKLLKSGKKCLRKQALRQKSLILVQQKMATNGELNPVKESFSTMTTRTGGVVVVDVNLRQSVTHVDQIRKCFMISVKINRTLRNTVNHTQLRMGQDLWKSAIRCLCNIVDLRMVHLSH